MKNRLVIIGANEYQDRLIVRASEMGYETHVFAWKVGAAGEQHADKFYPISILEKDEILAICREIKPAGIVTAGSDLAVETVNYIANALGLTANPMDVTILGRNKFLQRKAMREKGCPIPWFARVASPEEAENAIVDFPVIVKPTDRSGSRGVTKVNERSELRAAVSKAIEQSLEDAAVIEAFVTGDEYSVEFISHGGEHSFLAITKKYTTGYPNYIEVAHMQPTDLPEASVTAAATVVRDMLAALGVREGASHTEIIIDAENRINIIETGLRMGGDFIGSDMVWLSAGYDYLRMVIDIACGKAPDMTRHEAKGDTYVRYIFSDAELKLARKLMEDYPMAVADFSLPESIDGAPVSDSGERPGYVIFCAGRAVIEGIAAVLPTERIH